MSVVLGLLMVSIIYYLDPEVKTLIPTREKLSKAAYNGLYNFVVGKAEEAEAAPEHLRHGSQAGVNRPLSIGLDRVRAVTASVAGSRPTYTLLLQQRSTLPSRASC